MTIMDGKMLRDKIPDEVKSKIEESNLNIKLAIILVGDDEAVRYMLEIKRKHVNT